MHFEEDSDIDNSPYEAISQRRPRHDVEKAMRSHRGFIGINLRLINVLIMVVFLEIRTQAFGSPQDRSAIREKLKSLADGLGTVAYHSELTGRDPSGNPDRTQGSISDDFVWSADGRRGLKTTAILPSGEAEVITWTYQDPRKIYELTAFKNKPNEIDRLFVRNRDNAATNNREIRPTIPSWFFLPKGRHLYTHLDDGASLESIGDRKDVIILEIIAPKKIRFTLDPNHDWWPSRVEFVGSRIYVVNQFGRDNGHWFPVEILELKDNKEQRATVMTRVSDLRINRSLPDSALRPPDLPDGTAIEDLTQNRGEFKGGKEARRIREAQFAPKRDVKGDEADLPIVASREPGDIRWSSLIGICSVSFVVTAGVAVFLRRKS